MLIAIPSTHRRRGFNAELFNSTNPAGQFLSIDSSIMNITTSGDALCHVR